MVISFFKSDIGKLRENNEDALYASDEHLLFLLADGMGGHLGGEIASNMAIKIIARELVDNYSKLGGNDELNIKKAFRKANQEILRMSQDNTKLLHMGTTIVLVKCLYNKKFYVAHLGDSRVYKWQSELKRLFKLTDDHTALSEMKKKKISQFMSNSSGLKHVLTKFLGSQKYFDPELQDFRWRENDCLLLCSDGLTNMMDDKQIEKIIEENILFGSETVCEELIRAANEAGGYDNVSVIVIKNT